MSLLCTDLPPYIWNWVSCKYPVHYPVVDWIFTLHLIAPHHTAMCWAKPISLPLFHMRRCCVICRKAIQSVSNDHCQWWTLISPIYWKITILDATFIKKIVIELQYWPSEIDMVDMVKTAENNARKLSAAKTNFQTFSNRT